MLFKVFLTAVLSLNISQIRARDADLTGDESNLDDLRADRVVIAGKRTEKTASKRQRPWFESHYKSLTGGIKGNEILDPKNHRPSVLALFGSKAFPIWTSDVGDVKVAGAIFGKGRAVVAGSKVWFTADLGSDSLVKLLANAILWLNTKKVSSNYACHSSRERAECSNLHSKKYY